MHGLELQIGTMKEFSGGYHLHQIIPHRLQLGLVSQKHTATSHKVNREIFTVNLSYRILNGSMDCLFNFILHILQDFQQEMKE